MTRGVTALAAKYPSLRPAGLVGFWVAVAVWSWLLVKPNPFPETARTLSEWGELLPFLAAKSLHAGVYAGLTFVAAIVSTRHRTRLILFVALHGVLSELGQYYGDLWFGTGRVGCVRDVLVDWVGVAAGYGAWRVLSRSGEGEKKQPS